MRLADTQCHLPIKQDYEDRLEIRGHEQDFVRALTLIMKVPKALVVLFCSKLQRSGNIHSQRPDLKRLQMDSCLQRSGEWIYRRWCRVIQNTLSFFVLEWTEPIFNISLIIASVGVFISLFRHRWNHTPPRLGHSASFHVFKVNAKISGRQCCEEGDSWSLKLSR